jgi:2-polyprenyl-6-methoxyphenol hydroxylase-like FAD-dependent oxidoreductase
VVERLSTAHDGRWPFVVVDRSRLRGLLRARLPAGAVRLSKTPCGLDPTDSGLRVEFEDGVREPFDAVVGGDGARSWVRRSRIDAGGPATRGTATWTVRTDRPLGAPETVTELWTPDGALTCGPPAGAGRLQFVTSVDGPDPRPAPRAPRTTPSVDVAPDGDLDPAAAAARLAGVVERASFPTPGGEPVPSTVSSSELTLVGGAVDRHVRSERWTAGRVALVGAAARPLSPAVALGASLTVEDAYVLADELAGPAASTEALRRYARRRRGRYRALGRHLPFDATDTHPPGDDLHDLSARRAAVLRSVFARRLAAASGDVSERL